MKAKLNNWVKKRYYRLENRTSTIPTLSRSQVIKDIFSFFAALIAFSLVVLLVLSGEPQTKKQPNQQVLPVGLSEEELKNRPDGPQVISFRSLESPSGLNTAKILRSKGSLIRVRLLNTIETHENVPVFSQIIDYGLGTHLYGKTLIGEATGDGSIDRIKISFHTLRIGDYSAKDLSGHALSLDGTLGLAAKKKEGLFERSIVGSSRSGVGNSVSQDQLGESLQGFLLGALLRGIQTELRSDIESEYNNSTVLTLEPGVEFFVQITENFGEGSLQ